MTAPDRIWAKSQEWPKGSGRIEVYAAAKDDQDDPAVEYVRADVVDELAQALEGALALMPDDEGPEIDAARAALARSRGGA